MSDKSYCRSASLGADMRLENSLVLELPVVYGIASSQMACLPCSYGTSPQTLVPSCMTTSDCNWPLWSSYACMDEVQFFIRLCSHAWMFLDCLHHSRHIVMYPFTSYARQSWTLALLQVCILIHTIVNIHAYRAPSFGGTVDLHLQRSQRSAWAIAWQGKHALKVRKETLLCAIIAQPFGSLLLWCMRFWRHFVIRSNGFCIFVDLHYIAPFQLLLLLFCHSTF